MTAHAQQTFIKQEIANYMEQNTRNKIVFCKAYIDGLQYINVGQFVARLLQEGVSALDACQQLFSHPAYINNVIGRYLAFDNIGILLEPELKIDLRNLFDTQSNNHCLIIRSDAEISSDTFWWLSANGGVGIPLSVLSYKQF